MKDLELLDEYLNGNDEIRMYSKTSYFNNIAPTYLNTNEYLDLFLPVDLNNNKILTVTASGDQMLNFILNGAKKIDCFDYNIMAKHIAKMKLAMLKELDYKVYISTLLTLSGFESHIESNIVSANNCLYNIIDKISNYCDEDTLNVLQKINKSISNSPIESSSKIFIKQGENLFYNSFTNSKQNYNKLKENAFDTKISFKDSDLSDLHKIYPKEYDLIYISNILEYVEKWHDRYMIISDLLNLLNENGKLLDYRFSESDRFYSFIKESNINVNKRRYSYDNSSLIEYRR